MSPQGPENLKLTDCLREECDALRQCVELLEREQQLLMDGDIDALASLTGRKISALESAARITAVRERCLTDSGLPLNADGMSALLKNFPAMLEMWHEVLRRAKQARDLNRVNGLLMDARVDRNRHALAVMHQAANSPATYANDGHLRHAIPVRALGVG